MTDITDERRRELIGEFQEMEDLFNKKQWAIGITHMGIECITDILTILEREELPWKVHLISSPMGQGYHPPILVAQCNTKPSAQHMVKLWGSEYCTITGPDSEDKPCPDCNGSGRDNVPYGEQCDTCHIKAKIEAGDTSLEYEPEDVAFKHKTPTLDYVYARIQKGLPVADSEKNAAIKEAVEVSKTSLQLGGVELMHQTAVVQVKLDEANATIEKLRKLVADPNVSNELAGIRVREALAADAAEKSE